jgi:hypothetical protein
MVWLEALSYVVTILGFPGAIAVFVYEHRRRSANEENEIHRNLSEEYDNFLRWCSTMPTCCCCGAPARSRA